MKLVEESKVGGQLDGSLLDGGGEVVDVDVEESWGISRNVLP